MKIDYKPTIEELKEYGLINPGDKYAVCLFQTESESNGVTTTMITSTVDYIMVANENEVKLLDIDKKTGQYLDSFVVFEKANLVFEKKNKNWIYASKGLFGGRYIGIRADYMGFIHSYLLPKKVNGYEQTEARDELYNFVKEVYNAHHDEQNTDRTRTSCFQTRI